MGTSLVVHPFAGLIDKASAGQMTVSLPLRRMLLLMVRGPLPAAVCRGEAVSPSLGQRGRTALSQLGAAARDLLPCC